LQSFDRAGVRRQHGLSNRDGDRAFADNGHVAKCSGGQVGAVWLRHFSGHGVWRRLVPLWVVLGTACAPHTGSAPSEPPHPTNTSTTAAPGLVRTPIGKSVQGRPILVTRVGSGPVKVIWVGGIHGDEPEGAASTAALPELVANDSRLAGRLSLVVVEDANPDGRAAS